eukprot:PITA_23198
MKRFNANKNLPVNPNDVDFTNCAMEEILKLEKEIRDSDEEDIDCNGEELDQMLCLDGCFLIEALRTLGEDNISKEEADECYDPTFGENKLDYAAKDEKLVDLLKVILYWFNPFDKKEHDIKQWSCHYHHHLLGFLHIAIASPLLKENVSVICMDCCGKQCIVKLKDKSKAGNDAKIIPHAIELRNFGVRFKSRQGGINEIEFEKLRATIFLPPIRITDTTEIVLRNLIDFEMCKQSQINYVSCYVTLMENLIDSEEDVALLTGIGALTRGLGSDKEVANLFNGLCKGVTMCMEDVFNGLTENVNAHYKNKIKVHIGMFVHYHNGMKAFISKLVQDHFSSPWKALALTAATVILLLTMLQTIFTIISTYKSQ